MKNIIDLDLAKKLSIRFSSRFLRKSLDGAFQKLENEDWQVKNKDDFLNHDFQLNLKTSLAKTVFDYLTSDTSADMVLKREVLMNNFIDFESNLFFHKSNFKPFTTLASQNTERLKGEKNGEWEVFKNENRKNSSRIDSSFEKKRIDEKYNKLLRQSKINIPVSVLEDFISSNIQSICKKSLNELVSFTLLFDNEHKKNKKLSNSIKEQRLKLNQEDSNSNTSFKLNN